MNNTATAFTFPRRTMRGTFSKVPLKLPTKLFILTCPDKQKGQLQKLSFCSCPLIMDIFISGKLGSIGRTLMKQMSGAVEVCDFMILFFF